MNRLDPDLKRLMIWSRHAPPPASPDDAPLGFSSRVVAGWHLESPIAPILDLQRYVAIAAWASALVILCGVLFFVNQTRAPKLAVDFTSAAQFLARYVAP